MTSGAERVMTMTLRRASSILLFGLSAAALGAAPPAFTVVSDSLDANAPAATLPTGPVEQALAELAREQPQATLLVPLRRGERNGQRYALAAWQSEAGGKEWDALLVVATAAGARTVEASSVHQDRSVALEALIDFGTTGAPPAAAAKAPAVPSLAVSAEPLPSRWDIRFVVLYSRNPVYRPADAAAEAALTDAHIQYTLRLQQAGTAVVAGPFATGATADSAVTAVLVGMTLLRVRDLAAAERIAVADPAVIAGRLIATVREWQVPAGRIP